LENLSPLNLETLVKKLYRLSRNWILSSGTFYFEPPFMCLLRIFLTDGQFVSFVISFLCF